MDSSSWTKYSKPDAELEAILAQSPPIPSFADYGTAADIRTSVAQQLGQMVEAGLIKPVDWSSCSKSDMSIPTRDNAELRAVLYKPKESNDKSGGIFVYFHGGGWTFGFPEAGEAYFETLVKDLGMVVVSVGYRLAPEHRFPKAAEDAIDAVQWVSANAPSFGGDLNKGFILGGSSAGGSLASVASHWATDEVLKPPINGVVLLGPSLCHPDGIRDDWKEHYNSWEEFKNGAILDQRGMNFFYEQYQPDPKSPLASPLLWKTHNGQPRTYLQVMGADLSRDEALIYEHVLRDAGAQTRLDVYPGIPHGGPDFFPMHTCAKKAVEDTRKGVEWILGL